jgi:hypothetical protein
MAKKQQGKKQGKKQGKRPGIGATQTKRAPKLKQTVGDLPRPSEIAKAAEAERAKAPAKPEAKERSIEDRVQIAAFLMAGTMAGTPERARTNKEFWDLVNEYADKHYVRARA